MTALTKRRANCLAASDQALRDEPFQAARNWSDFLDAIAPVQTMGEILAEMPRPWLDETEDGL